MSPGPRGPARIVPLLPDLHDRVLVLDGGMSNALEDRGVDLTDDLWTARLLRDDPDRIVAVHRAYFDGGADVATTASYQASVPGLVAAGLSATEAAALIASSVRLAVEARDAAAERSGRHLLVAASVGPYGAVLADGSEYRGRYGLSAAADWVRAGARLVGGCCRVGPADIAALARSLASGR